MRRVVVGLCRRLILYDWYHIMEQDGKRIVLGLSRGFILYDWFHIMEQDGEEDSCRFVEEVYYV